MLAVSIGLPILLITVLAKAFVPAESHRLIQLGHSNPDKEVIAMEKKDSVLTSLIRSLLDTIGSVGIGGMTGVLLA